MAGLLNYKDDPVMGLIGDIYKGAGQRVGDYFKPEKHGLTDQQLKDYMMGFQTMGEGFDDYINQPDAPFGTTQTGEEYTNRVNIGQSMLPVGSQLSGLAHGRAAIDQAQRMYNGEDVLGEDGLLLPALGNAGVGLAELAQMGAIPKSLLGMGAMVKAYHGTPHKVDKFRMDKIGTGEGAQAYGHGLYFAESPDVAKSYAPRDFDAEDIMMQKYKAAEAADNTTAMEIHERAMMHDTADEIAEYFKSSDVAPYHDPQKVQDAIDEVRDIERKMSGNLYNVELDVNHEDLLDWDAPLSEQSEKVSKALDKAGISAIHADETAGEMYKRLQYKWTAPPIGDIDASNLSTADMMSMMSANKHKLRPDSERLSKALKEAGIPGIRYLDQGSRGSKEGTRNLVMFDEDLIKIADDVPKNDLVVANKYEKGTLKGKPGDLHYAVNDSPERKNMGELIHSGWMDSSGKFYSRDEALKYSRETNPDQMGMEDYLKWASGLDAKDYNASTGVGITNDIPQVKKYNLTDSEDLIKIADDFKFPDELKSLKGEPVNKINEMRATTKANPVTVYHSTGEQFDKFDPEKGIGGQMWFTSRKDLAEQGYDGAVSKGRLVEAELDIRNPASWAEYDKYGTDELLGMGYDGVKLEQNGEDVYIALFPEQIRVKSNK